MIKLLSPAKINLYLHFTGKRTDGYHFLDSLVMFTNTGDELTFTPQSGFSFAVSGPYASGLSTDSSNLVVRAAEALSITSGHALDVAIHLTKNLPLGSGIGGGSSNAAACLSGLAELWGLDIDLSAIAATLGSDVPVCLPPYNTKHMQGIGDIINPAPTPPLHLLLVNPNIPCPTPAVYKAMKVDFTGPLTLPEFSSAVDLIEFLKTKTRNDMTDAAIGIVPEIKTILDVLKNTKNCQLARLSGSGATCFGIFDTAEAAKAAQTSIYSAYPNWWVTTS